MTQLTISEIQSYLPKTFILLQDLTCILIFWLKADPGSTCATFCPRARPNPSAYLTFQVANSFKHSKEKRVRCYYELNIYLKESDALRDSILGHRRDKRNVCFIGMSLPPSYAECLGPLLLLLVLLLDQRNQTIMHPKLISHQKRVMITIVFQHQ